MNESSRSTLAELTGRLFTEENLWREFLRLCDFGGRFSGTAGERAALAHLEARLREAGLDSVERWAFDYRGWSCPECRVEIPSRPDRMIASLPLVYSAATPAGGLLLETIDAGRGAAADFARLGTAAAGKAVLIDAEYSFSTASLHRRVKFLNALGAGAAALLIVNFRPGCFPATGSTRPEGSDIPCAGIAKEDGALLRRLAGGPEGKIRLTLRTETAPARSANLIARLPGRGGGRKVILSAHYDGHNCGESALDNASGAAAALELCRLLAGRVGQSPNDLEAHFYTVEEWGLQGSRVYVESLSEEELDRIALNLNLDVVAGSPNLTFICNGFADLEEWVRRVLRGEPASWRTSRRVAINSDHANFLRKGVPAVRALAGMNEPGARSGFHLSPADTSDKVPRAELTAAAAAVARVLVAALDEENRVARRRSPEEVERLTPFPYGFGPELP